VQAWSHIRLDFRVDHAGRPAVSSRRVLGGDLSPLSLGTRPSDCGEAAGTPELVSKAVRVARNPADGLGENALQVAPAGGQVADEAERK
jgi:hypothetical protein